MALSCSEISLTASADRSVGVSSGAAALPRVSRARTLLTAVTLEDGVGGNGTSPAASGTASSRRKVAGSVSFYVGRGHLGGWCWGNGASPAASGTASSRRNVAGNLSFHV